MRPRRLSLLAAITAAGALSGCLVGPRYSPPAPAAPAAWPAAQAPAARQAGVTPGEAADDAWWNSFGDAELASLIKQAVAHNLEARQAVLRIEEARAQRRLAAAGAWPSLDAGGSLAETRISTRTDTTSLLNAFSGSAGSSPGVAGKLPGLVNPFPQWTYGLTGSWEVDLFGRVRRQVEAASASADAASDDERSVRVSLMAEVAAAYVDLRAAQAQLGVATARLANARTLAAVARDARRSDLADDSEVARAVAAAAVAEAALGPLGAEIALDKNQLALLISAEPGALDAELDRPSAILSAPPQALVGTPSELARRRPDVRAAEARLHAAVAGQGVAMADLYPRLTLGASAGLEASNTAALTDWAARYFSAGPALSLPVFDAGQRRANLRIADLRAKEAATAYAQTVLGALHEVDRAISVYAQEQTRRQALAAAEQQQRVLLSIADRRYQAGAASYRALLEARDQEQAAMLALDASTAAASQDFVEIYRALGGGWRADDPG